MQRWTEIPPHIRTQHKEAPDIWKEALGLENKKGKVRLQSVPLPVLTSLDEHMSLMTSGASEVTARNEEVMIWQIVTRTFPY